MAANQGNQGIESVREKSGNFSFLSYPFEYDEISKLFLFFEDKHEYIYPLSNPNFFPEILLIVILHGNVLYSLFLLFLSNYFHLLLEK